MTVKDIREKIVLRSVTWISQAEQPIGRGRDLQTHGSQVLKQHAGEPGSESREARPVPQALLTR